MMWKETKQQLRPPGPNNILGCCLVSFHFLWAILSTSTVQKQVSIVKIVCVKSMRKQEGNGPIDLGVNSIDINLGPKIGRRCKIENTGLNLALVLAQKLDRKLARYFLCQLN